ncbi:MAG: four helix bundle protein [Geminicoccaceae bacterium]
MNHADGDNARQTGPALEAMYRFMLWLIPTVEKFPWSQKFLLGDRIQGTALDVLERLIGATDTDGWRARIASRVGHDEESPAPGSQ